VLLPGESCLQIPVWLFSYSYKTKIPTVSRDSFMLFFISLTKAPRTISKIVAKIKTGVCFCNCHDSDSKIINCFYFTNLILIIIKKPLFKGAVYIYSVPELFVSCIRAHLVCTSIYCSSCINRSSNS
jgi:hypothetical protein